MRRHIASLRVPYWRVAPVMPIGRAAARPDLIPGAGEVREMLEYVRRSREDGLLPQPEFCEEGFLGNRFEGVVRPYLAQCRAGVTTAGILSDGRIGACPELGDAFAQGDIRRERFKEVWDTRYQVLRERAWTKKGRCGDCQQYARCNGGSLHLYPSPQGELLRCLYWMAKDAESAGGA
jgi:radical SAM protein with 4Fe4S-binding SPASM domain